MPVRVFLSLTLALLISWACSSSPEDKLITGFFDSIYGEKRIDAYLPRMVEFFAEDVREKRLPIFRGKQKFSEVIKSHQIENLSQTRTEDRLTINGTVVENHRDGKIIRKGFIARLIKKYTPDGKDSLWMLYDMVFSPNPVKDPRPWLELVKPQAGTLKLLSGVTNQVNILLFGKFYSDPGLHVLRELASALSSEVSFTWLDPSVEHGMVASYGINRNSHIVIESSTRRAILPLAELYQEEGSASDQTARVLMAERKLLSALLRVAGSVHEIVFVNDHYSRPLVGIQTNSLSEFFIACSNSGFAVRTCSFDEALATNRAGNESRPLLVFSDPRLTPPESLNQVLFQELANESLRALFLFDTPFSWWASATARRFGHTPLGLTIVDPSNKDSFRGARWIESKIHSHDATQHFFRRPDFRVLIAGAEGLVELETKPSDFQARALISSSSNSWAETAFDREKPDEFEFNLGLDIPGPFDFGLAVTTSNQNPAAILISDCDFVANQLARSRISNRLFVFDLLEWLTLPEVHQIASRPCPRSITQTYQ